MAAGSNRIALCCAIALGCLAGVAHAQPAAATVQFDRGRDMMKQGKYAEACAAFEQSQKLDPQNGTLYNLAGCYVKLGKLASAWAAYHELAARDGNAARRKDSEKREKELTPRLSKLLIKAPEVPGLVVQMNGLDVTGLVNVDTPVDVGTYKLEARANGKKPWTATKEIKDEGKTVTVEIAFDQPAAPDTGKVTPTNPPPATHPVDTGNPTIGTGGGGGSGPVDTAPKSNRKLYGAITLGAGGALVVTGLVFGSRARAKWNNAKEICGADLLCDSNGDLSVGNQLVDEARSAATLSTVLVIGGVAAAGLGTYLIVSAPKRAPTSTAWRITPSVGPTAVGVTLGGGF
ncbi:MAG TPA: tetratricopeptide repeat protein [Kofleriaceae bacterium]|nr:tetratricopeptide repeat protein [Kofleriaceae bacterium]